MLFNVSLLLLLTLPLILAVFEVNTPLFVSNVSIIALLLPSKSAPKIVVPFPLIALFHKLPVAMVKLLFSATFTALAAILELEAKTTSPLMLVLPPLTFAFKVPPFKLSSAFISFVKSPEILFAKVEKIPLFFKLLNIIFLLFVTVPLKIILSCTTSPDIVESDNSSIPSLSKPPSLFLPPLITCDAVMSPFNFKVPVDTTSSEFNFPLVASKIPELIIFA